MESDTVAMAIILPVVIAMVIMAVGVILESSIEYVIESKFDRLKSFLCKEWQYLYGIPFFIIIPVLLSIWPITAFISVVCLSLRFLRFICRMGKAINKLGSDSHRHNETGQAEYNKIKVIH